MKSILLSCAAVLAMALTPAFAQELAIGEAAPMPDAPMMGVDGEKHTLNSLKQENGLLVIFSCNTCPFVVGNGTKTEDVAKNDDKAPKVTPIYTKAQSDEISGVIKDAKQGALAQVALFPLLMLGCYVVLIMYYNGRGGYKPVELGAEGESSGDSEDENA